MSYGKMKVLNDNGSLNRTIELINYAQYDFKDHRVVTVAETEENTYNIAVESPQSTGRTSQTMHLSEESMIAIFTAIGLYLNQKGLDSTEMAKSCLESEFMNYRATPELKRIGEIEP